MRTVSLAFVLVSLSFSPAILAGETTVPSQPHQATIYRDGYAVLEEKLPLNRATGAIRLPAGTDLASVRVFAAGQRLPDLGIEELKERETKVEKTYFQGQVVEKPVEIERRVGYLLRLGSAPKGKLTLRYGTTGIAWHPHLEADLLDGRKARMALTALVTNSALDLRDCRIRLASSAGAMSSKIYFATAARYGQAAPGATLARSADVVYDGGRRSIGKDRSGLLTLVSTSTRYEQKLIWHTDTRERVRVVLVMPNPFPVPICPAPASLNRGGVLLAKDSAEWAPPGAPVVLAAGHAPAIEVERSVDTTENLANKARPFRHAIEFKVANRGRERIRLEVLMPKRIGVRHKTLYKFKREPDGRPGDLYLWKLDLKPGKDEVIAFRFDSEHARFSGYQTYEKARYAH